MKEQTVVPAARRWLISPSRIADRGPAAILCNSAIRSPQSAILGGRRGRLGITLTEVLISLGLMTLGLLGVLALFPVGSFYMLQAEVADRGSAIGRAVMSDIERWPEWTPSVTSIEVLDSGPLREGLRAKIGVKGAPSVTTWTVSSATYGKEFTWGTSAPGVRTVATHALEPNGEGTRVTLGVQQSGPGTILFGPWLRKVSKRNLEMEANGLKRASEANAPVPA